MNQHPASKSHTACVQSTDSTPRTDSRKAYPFTIRATSDRPRAAGAALYSTPLDPISIAL
eukprot:3470569-Prymnesium_polylepis.1